MRERPIIFSGPMVRAILNGDKTQTRRVIKPQPDSNGLWSAYDFPRSIDESPGWKGETEAGETIDLKCPYGVPGDRLWVKETWTLDCNAIGTKDEKDYPIIYRATDSNGLNKSLDGKWRPSIFMPRLHSRITLEVVSVRPERLQVIDAADAYREGIREHFPVDRFRRLWDSINAKKTGCAWNDNPWVWVITFKRIP